MSITLNGTTGITTPDLTSAAPMDVGGSAVLTAASSLAAANLTGALPAIDGSALTGLSAGAWSLLASVASTSGTSISFGSTYITSDYGAYQIVFENVKTTLAFSLLYAYSADNGSTLLTGTNVYSAVGYRVGASNLLERIVRNENAAFEVGNGINLQATYPTFMQVEICNPALSQPTIGSCAINGWMSDGSGAARMSTVTVLNISSAVNYVKFTITGGGSFSGGNVRLYGQVT